MTQQLQQAKAKLRLDGFVLSLGGGNSSASEGGITITSLASMASLQSTQTSSDTLYDLPDDGTTLTSDEQALDSNN